MWKTVRKEIVAFAWVFSCLGDFQTRALDPTNDSVKPGIEPDRKESTYEAPNVLTATIYQREGGTNRPVFKFKRIAAKSGTALHVLSEYLYPDGKIAAREKADYQDNLLANYEMNEVQTGANGSAKIERDLLNKDKGRIVFQFTKAGSKTGSIRTRTEALLPDTVVNDTVGPFVASHWDALWRGDKVPCRFIVVSREQTVGFTFRKESETKWRGHDVIVVKMEPLSLLVAAFVEPLHFVVEKDPPHRVLEYTGRTTPKLGQAGHWTDFDSVTVFDW